MKISMRLLCLAFLFIASLAACSPTATPTASTAVSTPPSAQPTRLAPTTPPSPRPVLIDTDMAADDWMAILYLLQRTDIAVQAITVAGTGESHCAPGIKNASGLVALAGRAPIPAACGRETPLSGAHTFPQGWRSSADTLGGLSVPAGQNALPSPVSAPALLAQRLLASPQKMTLLATGPLTNLGELLQASPGVKDKIDAIYIMGGAVHVPGNMGPSNTAAEWNIYVDPQAANIVFASGVPVILVALDATNHNPATPAFYKKLQASHLTPEATFVYDLFTKNRSYQSGSFYFWDPTAAVLLSDESLGSYEDDPLCVVEAEGNTSGQTEIKPGCPTVRVAISADSARFEQVFLDTLNNP